MPACGHLCPWTLRRVRASVEWAPLRVPGGALGLRRPAASLEQTHCPLALRRLKVPGRRHRAGSCGSRRVHPQALPSPSCFPSFGRGPRGVLDVLAFGGGLPDGERGQLDWGPRATEGCSQLVTSSGPPGMAPRGATRTLPPGAESLAYSNQPGSSSLKGGPPNSEHPTQQKHRTTDTQHPSPSRHTALTPCPSGPQHQDRHPRPPTPP